MNTMGLDIRAKFLSTATHVDELRDSIRWAKKQDLPVLILGGGSNILFTQDYEGLVILNRIRGKVTLQENDELVHLYVGSGENWHELVEFSVNKGWYGIENLALIPGLVGAAPIQNIGAYGMEIREVLLRVHALDLESLEERSFTNEECQFAYRQSIFKKELKNKVAIIGVELILYKQADLKLKYGDIQRVLEEQGKEASIRSVFETVIQIRQSKLPDPAELGNTGSFFKNPIVEKETFEHLYKQHPNMPHYPLENGQVKIPAAWLIEQAGWKGKVVGATGNHARQALVIVNYGGAKGLEILEHAQQVVQSIVDQFGIRLEAEVNIL